MVLLSGCASYSSSFQKIELLLEQQKPKEALLELEQHPRSNKDKLLYLLDKAMLQRMSGLYLESNASFEEAKALIDKLQGTSLVEQAGALTINDSTMSYEGDDFEQVSIHIYEALNYIALGQLDEARVEALQVDVRLKKLAEGESGYVEDAFSRYLAGLIYEAEGEYDDAMIAYRKAYKAYKNNKLNMGVPIFLQQDLLRLSKKLGLADEHETFQKAFALDESASLSQKGKGEVVLLLFDSLAPIKRSVSLLVYTDTGIPKRISMPEYQSRPSYISRARLTVGTHSMDAELVDDFDAIARASLESHKPAMIARLLARAILKANISKNAQKQGGELAGFLVDAVAMATETADTRSWLTLPKSIYLSRLMLEPGVYPASLTLFGKQGEVMMVMDLGQVEINKGKKLFMEKSFIAPYRKSN